MKNSAALTYEKNFLSIIILKRVAFHYFLIIITYRKRNITGQQKYL